MTDLCNVAKYEKYLAHCQKQFSPNKNSIIEESSLLSNFLNTLVPLPPLPFEQGGLMLWERSQKTV